MLETSDGVIVVWVELLYEVFHVPLGSSIVIELFIALGALIVVKAEQWSNIYPVPVTFVILNDERSRLVKLLQ